MRIGMYLSSWIRLAFWLRPRATDSRLIPHGWAGAGWGVVAFFLATTGAFVASVAAVLLTGWSARDIASLVWGFSPLRAMLFQASSAIYLALVAGAVSLVWGGLLSGSPVRRSLGGAIFLAALRTLLPLSLYRLITPLVTPEASSPIVDIVDEIIVPGIVGLAGAFSISQLIDMCEAGSPSAVLPSDTRHGEGH